MAHETPPGPCVPASAHGRPILGENPFVWPTECSLRTIRPPSWVAASVAYVIDSVLIAIVGVAVMALTKNHAYTGAPSGACQALRDSGNFSGQCVQLGSRVYTWKSGGLLVGYGLGGLIGLANLVVLQGITGASIGKFIFGLRVVNGEGRPCGVGRALVRWLILILLDGACFLIGLIVALATHPHRRIGDMAGGTYVVALADVGRPVVAAVPPPYAYSQPGAGGWAPPGTQPPPPSWGAPPPGAQPPPPSWGATPPSAWGTPADNPPPAWGAPDPAAPPPPPTATPWSAPPAPTPPPDRTGWGAPASTWGTPPAPTPDPPAADSACPHTACPGSAASGVG